MNGPIVIPCEICGEPPNPNCDELQGGCPHRVGLTDFGWVVIAGVIVIGVCGSLVFTAGFVLGRWWPA